MSLLAFFIVFCAAPMTCSIIATDDQRLNITISRHAEKSNRVRCFQIVYGRGWQFKRKHKISCKVFR